ncbi:hypothetical protein U0L90_08080 [Flavobacteriaceae sp. LMIT009]
MKSYIRIFCTCLLFCAFTLQAQNSQKNNFLDRSPVYDYNESKLNNTDTIPGFGSKENKLKISGTIYKGDGVTPASDVVLYIEQADENGNFDLRKENDKRYVHNRGWIKTDSEGRYTFYTYVPGNDRRYNQLKQLFPIIKEPSKSEYQITSFLFDDDPLLTKRCRKRMDKKGDPSRILKLEKVDGIFITQKDIILHDGILTTK